jgi:hypothetical protein
MELGCQTRGLRYFRASARDPTKRAGVRAYKSDCTVMSMASTASVKEVE